MKAIQKGSEPRSLTQHRLATHATYDNYEHKDELRTALIAEQHGICCYCMKRIRPQPDQMKIEHWHCQDEHPTEQLNYANLLGACLGNEGQPLKEQHCDTHKGNVALSRNPADPMHKVETVIKYLGDGRIVSTDATFDHEINDVLNLNLPFLINNRKAVLDGFIKSLPTKGTLNPDFWQRKLKILGEAQELQEYCGVVMYWLEKRLK